MFTFQISRILLKEAFLFDNKNASKLRESCNMLTQLQFVKGDEYISRVIVLGTTQRITLQVQEIFFSLQEKQLFLGSSNNQQQNAPFLLLSILTDLVEQQTRIRNDPSSNPLLHMGKTS